MAPDEWTRRLATLPLLYQPGERWLYHTGSDVLGVLVARAAGQPLDAFLRERVFEPLGMSDTAFATDRVDRLRNEGVTAAGLGRIMAPIGLDLGARTPEETAVSICAEIIALRTGRQARSLRDTDGPIHA